MRVWRRLAGGVLCATTSVAAGSLAIVQAHCAWSQNYPDRPIRLVVPFPPGGNVDSFARVLARQVEPQLGQSIVIDNRGGANGIVGADIVAKAVPNGYTLLGTSIAFVVNAGMYKKLPYDSEQDFAPITNFAWGLGYLLTVNPAVPAQTVRELIALARSSSEALRYSTPGIGNGQHLAAELFTTKAGIRLLHVPYKGGGPALNAVLGGEVQITFPATAVGAPHVRAGKLRALGFTGATRVASLPDVPTIAEAGVPGYRFDSGWHAWFAPAKTPAAVINRLYAAIRAALREPRLREYFVAGGYEPRGDPPEEFRRIFKSDIGIYAEIVRAAKIELQ